jgi:hypothetical protein
LTAPARGGCEIDGRDGRMARGAAEQKNGRTAISAIVVSVMKKSLVHLIRGADCTPVHKHLHRSRHHLAQKFQPSQWLHEIKHDGFARKNAT